MSSRNEVSGSRQILEEHEALHRELHALEVAADAGLSGQIGAGWTEDVIGQLARLRPQLERHFRNEVDLGLFGEIERSFPNTERACRQFSAEHQLFLHQLGEIARLSPGSVQAPVLARQAKALVGAIRRHEERENDLLRLVLEGGPPAGD